MIINPFHKGESIKMVFVYNQDGKRLMPTHPAKARILLKKKLAKVIKMYPFTIKLNYLIKNPVYQEITIGIDPGETIGISITTDKRVLFEAKLEQRTDIPKLLETRRNTRRTRRNRLRYRKPRFNNKRNKYNQVDKWLPPSLQADLLTYVNLVQFFDKLVPISKVRYEYNNFDIQKLKDPNIQGTDYQHGTLYQEENIKSYVRTRDNYTCQKCNKHIEDLPKGIKLEVHHIKPRSQGGTNVPNNLITLCSKCHKQVHEYLKKNKNVKFKILNYKEATKLNILKNLIYEELTKLGFIVEITYGYETKIKRQQLKLEKDHHIDARVIANGKMTRSRNDTKVYSMKKIRNHNRKIFKDKILKGNIKKRNQCEYIVYGFRRYDIIKYDNQFWYINSLRFNGSFQLKQLNSNQITNRIYKKLKLIQKRNKYIWS